MGTLEFGDLFSEFGHWYTILSYKAQRLSCYKGSIDCRIYTWFCLFSYIFRYISTGLKNKILFIFKLRRQLLLHCITSHVWILAVCDFLTLFCSEVSVWFRSVPAFSSRNELQLLPLVNFNCFLKILLENWAILSDLGKRNHSAIEI